MVISRGDANLLTDRALQSGQRPVNLNSRCFMGHEVYEQAGHFKQPPPMDSSNAGGYRPFRVMDSKH
ncbi:unnamed protein product [Pieris macdunnoughi]|uniref:Uncharacterized protein n=1 Tax=Pieris macdunnoughi TaxID=345717 RepID=A0A821SB86_9NEOP|nr:unnamed protein product [Pieris macdunnoughi]